MTMLDITALRPTMKGLLSGDMGDVDQFGFGGDRRTDPRDESR
jgi:hypothetical protein